MMISSENAGGKVIRENAGKVKEEGEFFCTVFLHSKRVKAVIPSSASFAGAR